MKTHIRIFRNIATNTFGAMLLPRSSREKHVAYAGIPQPTRKTLLPLVIATIILSTARVALAHPNHGGGGLAAGIAHPFTGIDHILAMLAVGLWAGQRGGRAMWMIPSTFLSLMIVGGLWAALGGPLPMMESGIAASVLVLGLIIASATRLPVALSMAIVGLFAIFHGYAHIAESAQTISGLQYATGFVLSTATLHALGLGLGLFAQRFRATPLLRITGAGIAISGVLLFTGIL